MRTAPWTVDLGNVADHARPLARWINRTLWNWSPWHLKHSLTAAQEENARLRLHLHTATAHLNTLVEEHMEPVREGIERAASYAGFHFFVDQTMETGHIRVSVPSFEAVCSITRRSMPDAHLKEYIRRLGHFVGKKLAEDGVKEFIKAGIIMELGL